MRRVLVTAMVAALGLSTAALFHASAATDPFGNGFGWGSGSDWRNFGSFPGVEPRQSPLPQRKPAGAEKPAEPRIADEPDPAMARKRLLDDLFQRLKASSDDLEAQGIAGAIERIWLASGSDTADLLMRRALRAESAQKFQAGAQLLNAIVQIDPTWAEAWNELAISSVRQKNLDAAMIDLAHALAAEPRHFGAMTGLGVVLMRSGDDRDALTVFRRVLDIYPRFTPIASLVDRLTIKVEGRDL